MSLLSFPFLLGVLLLTAFFFYLPTVRWRRLVLFLVNVAFIWLCLPDPASLAALALFVLSGYGVASLLKRFPDLIIFWTYLIVQIAAFLILKKYALLEPLLPRWIWNHPVVAVGLSYVLFRQIHFLVDVMQGQIDDFTLGSYLNYQINLFGFLAGPIQRYQEFQPTWSNWEPVLLTSQGILIAFARLFFGFLKISLSLKLFDLFDRQRHWFTTDLTVLDSHAKVFARALVLFYSYPVYLYLNFSGYCDVVIAAGALIGIRLPENFDRPYLSRNVIDYWTRFHRSLGFWIRDYLFTPMYKAVAERWSNRAAVLVFPCYFVAFVLAGIWHGSTTNFVVFGILHGCGASSVKMWEWAIVRRIGRKGLRTYLASRPIRLAAIALTIHFICFTMLFFPHDLATTRAMMIGVTNRLKE